MQRVYLLLAVIGGIVPYLFLGPYLATAGFDPAGFLGAAFANPVASGLTADLLISSGVLFVLIGANGDGRRAGWFVALNVLVGLSCALPAYLYVRERERGAVALTRAPAR